MEAVPGGVGEKHARQDEAELSGGDEAFRFDVSSSAMRDCARISLADSGICSRLEPRPSNMSVSRVQCQRIHFFHRARTHCTTKSPPGALSFFASSCNVQRRRVIPRAAAALRYFWVPPLGALYVPAPAREGTSCLLSSPGYPNTEGGGARCVLLLVQLGGGGWGCGWGVGSFLQKAPLTRSPPAHATGLPPQPARAPP